MKYFFINFLLLTFYLPLSYAQVPGNIIVRPDSEQIPISPLVFSAGDDMSHCFSPLSQTQPLIAQTKPPLLRIGGISSEYFDWEADSLAGIFYIDFFDTLTIPLLVNFGVDSLLRLCEDINAEPILTVNMHIADTALAARMVEYVNGDTTTPMGQLRAQRGHPEPYNVSIWSLGNEPDVVESTIAMPPWGYWTFLRHFGVPFANWSWQDSSFWSPQDFANLVPQYVNAMENASPIPLEFIYSIADDVSWIRPVIEPNINLIDYLDVHYYPTSVSDSIADTTDYIDWLSRTDTIMPAEEWIQEFQDTLDAIGASNVDLVVLEYNSGIILVPDALWWNYLTGLFIADCAGHWMHQGIKIAAVYCLHEGSPSDSAFPHFSVIRGDSISRRMPSHVLELYNTYFGDTLIYSFSDHKNSGYGIECWASKRSSDNKYVLVVINKTLDTTYAMTMQIKDSLQNFHLLNITNNAPLAAPFNGTTGIEDQGNISPDSIRSGWTFLTLEFEPASISLFEVTRYIGILENTTRPLKNYNYSPTIFTGPLILPEDKNYKIYDITGRTVAPEQLKPGIYFIEIEDAISTKIIKIR